MPMASTYADFIRARNSGRTNTVEVLERIFNEIDTDHPHWEWFSRTRTLDNPIPADVRNYLQIQGMEPAEINHLDDWPAQQKERVRRKIAENITGDNRRVVRLAWAVDVNGQREAMEVADPDENGNITIAAVTPWRNIRISADGQSVSVQTGG
jgi:hypothetical protein